MQDHSFLQYAVVLLLAAVIAVPVAKRWKLGAVLGYLGAGVLIGPSGLRLIGNTAQIGQLSEFGVVLMLFVIGMEVSPQRLWVMRRSVFGAGSVHVAADYREDGWFVLSVRDTGIGMAPEQIPMALEPFRQIASPLARNAEGTGLGLALVKSLVECHDGVLEIESALNRGTVVRLLLPPSRTVRRRTALSA